MFRRLGARGRSPSEGEGGEKGQALPALRHAMFLPRNCGEGKAPITFA
jgi:hypothetical protein